MRKSDWIEILRRHREMQDSLEQEDAALEGAFDEAWRARQAAIMEMELDRDLSTADRLEILEAVWPPFLSDEIPPP